MRIVFMGTPDFAVPSLRALASAHDIVGVVTQPDRPAGRGRPLQPPPVKQVAGELAIGAYQPESLKRGEAFGQLASWDPELIVVVAFGQILPPPVLELPPHGCLNVHASLLPRWRGASPVQHAILHGDDVTGVTLMKMDEGLDTGPILAQRTTPIEPGETGGELSKRLSVIGAELLLETLPGYAEGELEPQPQSAERATLAPMLKKRDGLLDFSKTAEALERQVLAFQPWPGTFFRWGSQRIAVHQVSPVEAKAQALPGTVVEHDGRPAVATGEGLLVLELIQPAGKQPMPAEEFIHGARGFVGSQLTAE